MKTRSVISVIINNVTRVIKLGLINMLAMKRATALTYYSHYCVHICTTHTPVSLV